MFLLDDFESFVTTPPKPSPSSDQFCTSSLIRTFSCLGLDQRLTRQDSFLSSTPPSSSLGKEDNKGVLIHGGEIPSSFHVMTRMAIFLQFSFIKRDKYYPRYVWLFHSEPHSAHYRLHPNTDAGKIQLRYINSWFLVSGLRKKPVTDVPPDDVLPSIPRTSSRTFLSHELCDQAHCVGMKLFCSSIGVGSKKHVCSFDVSYFLKKSSCSIRVVSNITQLLSNSRPCLRLYPPPGGTAILCHSDGMFDEVLYAYFGRYLILVFPRNDRYKLIVWVSGFLSAAVCQLSYSFYTRFLYLEHVI